MCRSVRRGDLGRVEDRTSIDCACRVVLGDLHMDFVGIRDVLRIGIRQLIVTMPYIIGGVIILLWGEGRAWISRRNLLNRINRSAIDELSHNRIKALEKENRELLVEMKRLGGENRLYRRRLQTAFMDTDWGQEIINKIDRDRKADESGGTNGKAKPHRKPVSRKGKT